MKRQEVKELMEKGVLYSSNWGKECRVIHLFRHRTWLSYNGRIASVPHKYVNNLRHEEGDSSYNHTNRATKEVLETLMKEYKPLLQIAK